MIYGFPDESPERDEDDHLDEKEEEGAKGLRFGVLDDPIGEPGTEDEGKDVPDVRDTLHPNGQPEHESEARHHEIPNPLLLSPSDDQIERITLSD